MYDALPSIQSFPDRIQLVQGRNHHNSGLVELLCLHKRHCRFQPNLLGSRSRKRRSYRWLALWTDQSRGGHSRAVRPTRSCRCTSGWTGSEPDVEANWIRLVFCSSSCKWNCSHLAAMASPESNILFFFHSKNLKITNNKKTKIKFYLWQTEISP